jgi:hypothetical protein
MSHETDWHVFDKACDITAMAVRGAAANDGVTPTYVGDLFREVHRSLMEAAGALEGSQQRAGF